MLAAQVIKGYAARTRYPMRQLTDENLDIEKVLSGLKPRRSSSRVQIEKGVRVFSLVLLAGLAVTLSGISPIDTRAIRNKDSTTSEVVDTRFTVSSTIWFFSTLMRILHLIHSVKFGCVFFTSGFHERCLGIKEAYIFFMIMQGVSALSATYSLVWLVSLGYNPVAVLIGELSAHAPILLILSIETLTTVFIMAATMWYGRTREFHALVRERSFPTGVNGVLGVAVEAIRIVLLVMKFIGFLVALILLLCISKSFGDTGVTPDPTTIGWEEPTQRIRVVINYLTKRLLDLIPVSIEPEIELAQLGTPNTTTSIPVSTGDLASGVLPLSPTPMEPLDRSSTTPETVAPSTVPMEPQGPLPPVHATDSVPPSTVSDVASPGSPTQKPVTADDPVPPSAGPATVPSPFPETNSS